LRWLILDASDSAVHEAIKTRATSEKQLGSTAEHFMVERFTFILPANDDL
jgi:hypothetical protein